jgi:hypothetical protein
MLSLSYSGQYGFYDVISAFIWVMLFGFYVMLFRDFTQMLAEFYRDVPLSVRTDVCIIR